jgi:hypothetical protein
LNLPTQSEHFVSEKMSRIEILKWWESKRIRYNLWVASVGVVSWLLVPFAGSAAVKPGIDFEEPFVMILGPIVFGILANVCFTFGWIVDSLRYRGGPRHMLYRSGLVLSIVLTSLPGVGVAAA